MQRLSRRSAAADHAASSVLHDDSNASDLFIWGSAAVLVMCHAWRSAPQNASVVFRTPTTDGQSDMQHVSVCCLVLLLTVQVLLKVLDHVGSQPGSTAMFEDSLKNLRQVQFWPVSPGGVL